MTFCEVYEENLGLSRIVLVGRIDFIAMEDVLVVSLVVFGILEISIENLLLVL